MNEIKKMAEELAEKELQGLLDRAPSKKVRSDLRDFSDLIKQMIAIGVVRSAEIDFHDYVKENIFEYSQYCQDMRYDYDKKIAGLISTIKDMKEVLEFYGDKEKYHSVHLGYGDREVMHRSDLEDLSSTDRVINFGGKRARACLEKHNDILKEIE